MVQAAHPPGSIPSGVDTRLIIKMGHHNHAPACIGREAFARLSARPAYPVLQKNVIKRKLMLVNVWLFKFISHQYSFRRFYSHPSFFPFLLTLPPFLHPFLSFLTFSLPPSLFLITIPSFLHPSPFLPLFLPPYYKIEMDRRRE